MAQILILARDSVLSAVLADRLESIGHRVDCLGDPLRLIETTSRKDADLLVLDLDVPGIPPTELVRTLRRQGSTRTASLLAYSDDTDPARRLAALRSGVDDILPSEIEVDELVLRIQRTLGSRTGTLPLLQGSLADHQLIEFLQYIRHSRRSGTLRIHSQLGAGHAEVSQGDIATAEWDGLQGASALLAILGLSHGTFRLDPQDEEIEGSAESIDLQDLVLRAAWLEDQSTVWRGRIPPTSAVLEVADASKAESIDSEFQDLPHEEILHLAAAPEGVRLFDLRRRAIAAPQELELSVALLLDAGALQFQELGGQELSTSELVLSDRLRWSVEALMERLRNQGFSSSAFSLLILFGEDRKAALEALLDQQRHPAVQSLVQQVKRRRGGSLVYPTDLGRLALHVQELNPDSLTKLRPILSACRGVLIWLGHFEDENLVQDLGNRLEPLASKTDVVLVADDEAARESVETLADVYPTWRLSKHQPRSLGAVLRYFPAPES